MRSALTSLAVPEGANGTVSLLTPAGRGAVGTLRYAGPPELLDHYFSAANGKGVAEQPIGRIVYGRWGRTEIEDLVLGRISETIAEIHCHGGLQASQRIIDDLKAQQVKQVDWATLFKQEHGVFAQELAAVVTGALTTRCLNYALAQAGGILANEINHLCWRLSLPTFVEQSQQIEADLVAILNHARVGLRLAQPWKVVLTGPPNVGKSSLMNALLGYERSVVFDQPGTTRDVVTGLTAFFGWPCLLQDTAGLRVTVDPLEADGVARARTTVTQADCVLELFDQSRPAREATSALEAGTIQTASPRILVAHKADLPCGQPVPGDAILVSSVTKAGLKELIAAMIKQLVPDEPAPAAALLCTTRQVKLAERALAAIQQRNPLSANSYLQKILHPSEN
jgi:tRNA modification GTPase